MPGARRRFLSKTCWLNRSCWNSTKCKGKSMPCCPNRLRAGLVSSLLTAASQPMRLETGECAGSGPDWPSGCRRKAACAGRQFRMGNPLTPACVTATQAGVSLVHRQQGYFGEPPDQAVPGFAPVRAGRCSRQSTSREPGALHPHWRTTGPRRPRSSPCRSCPWRDIR